MIAATIDSGWGIMRIWNKGAQLRLSEGKVDQRILPEQGSVFTGDINTVV